MYSFDDNYPANVKICLKEWGKVVFIESYIIILPLDGRVTFLSLSIGQILSEWIILATFYENNILQYLIFLLKNVFKQMKPYGITSKFGVICL